MLFVKADLCQWTSSNNGWFQKCHSCKRAAIFDGLIVLNSRFFRGHDPCYYVLNYDKGVEVYLGASLHAASR